VCRRRSLCGFPSALRFQVSALQLPSPPRLPSPLEGTRTARASRPYHKKNNSPRQGPVAAATGPTAFTAAGAAWAARTRQPPDRS